MNPITLAAAPRIHFIYNYPRGGREKLPLSDKPDFGDGELASISGKTLLLVEDHEMVRRLTARSLTSLGLNVTTVQSSDEAQQLFASGHRFDFVISDIRLPGEMDGLELANWIHEQFPETRIVLTTGLEEPDAKITYPMLTKPFSREMLIESIKKTLE